MSRHEYRARYRSPRNGEWHFVTPGGPGEGLDALWERLKPFREGAEPAAEIEIGVLEFNPVLTWKDHR